MPLGWQHIQYRDSRPHTGAPRRAPSPGARPGELAVAIHEIYHACAASYFAFPVRRCAVRPLACTDIVMAVEPRGLAAAFHAGAELALLDVAAAMAIVAAEAFANQRLLHRDGERHDVRVIEAYRQAYLGLPSRYVDSRGTRCLTPAWETILAQARAAVWRWRQRPGAVAAVMGMASHLTAGGHLGQAEWAAVWRSPLARPLRFTEKQGPHQSDRLKWWQLGESTNGPCAQCEAVAAENVNGVQEDEDFNTGIPGDTIAGPPLHPHCKCTVVYEKDMEK